ncbi:hypothetical protein LCGC14_0510970 [marine sediment metagenome]|uniref:Uncharacterized protein n=1 Tax=marine sediment metagenome TaxID=412755 RepID=A0A0F9S1B9_9ZZZZ
MWRNGLTTTDRSRRSWKGQFEPRQARRRTDCADDRRAPDSATGEPASGGHGGSGSGIGGWGWRRTRRKGVCVAKDARWLTGLRIGRIFEASRIRPATDGWHSGAGLELPLRGEAYGWPNTRIKPCWTSTGAKEEVRSIRTRSWTEGSIKRAVSSERDMTETVPSKQKVSASVRFP